MTDSTVDSNALGLSVAALSVVSSGMQQIFVRTLQQQHRVTSSELLGKTAPLQVTLGTWLQRRAAEALTLDASPGQHSCSASLPGETCKSAPAPVSGLSRLASSKACRLRYSLPTACRAGACWCWARSWTVT